MLGALMPAKLPGVVIAQDAPVDPFAAPAVHRLQFDLQQHAQLVMLQVDHQEVLFAIAWPAGGPLGQPQLARGEAVHRLASNRRAAS